jgi:hypothetical protein
MMRRRGGPGVLSTVARTAVIAGTATAVSNKANAKAAARTAASQHQPQVAQTAIAAEGELDQVKAQLAGLQAQQLETAALGESGPLLAQLQQLAQLKESGALTEEEFSAAKARVLAG